MNNTTVYEKKINKKEVIHNNYHLDNTINLLDIEITPTYKGCENKKTNLDKIACLNTNLVLDTRTKLIESGIIKKEYLKKGR